MTVNLTWVAKIRAVLAESQPAESAAETQARRDFRAFDGNTGQREVVQSPRARALREVSRIARWYGWQEEIERALDAAAADSLDALPLAALDQLRGRMRQLEDCAQHALGPPDSPPAG